jgi:hypothetical protein
MTTGDSFSRGKKGEGEADYSLTSNAEIKNGETITSLSHTSNDMVLN